MLMTMLSWIVYGTPKYKAKMKFKRQCNIALRYVALADWAMENNLETLWQLAHASAGMCLSENVVSLDGFEADITYYENKINAN